MATRKDVVNSIRTSPVQRDLVAYLTAHLDELRDEFEARVADEFTRGKIDFVKQFIKDIK